MTGGERTHTTNLHTKFCDYQVHKEKSEHSFTHSQPDHFHSFQIWLVVTARRKAYRRFVCCDWQFEESELLMQQFLFVSMTNREADLLDCLALDLKPLIKWNSVSCHLKKQYQCSKKKKKICKSFRKSSEQFCLKLTMFSNIWCNWNKLTY